MEATSFGRTARLTAADYARWQLLVRIAPTRNARVERPEVEGEPFRLLRYGVQVLATDDMRELERELMAL